jgi:hypothetical protein
MTARWYIADSSLNRPRVRSTNQKFRSTAHYLIRFFYCAGTNVGSFVFESITDA